VLFIKRIIGFARKILKRLRLRKLWYN
jgi:hypothetical protein